MASAICMITLVAAANAFAFNPSRPPVATHRHHHTASSATTMLKARSADETRRELFQKTTSALVGIATASAASGVALAGDASLSPEAARAQWNAAVQKLGEMDDKYDAVAAGGGDSVRTALGTAGQGGVSGSAKAAMANSPLYQIDKVLNVLLTEADDPDTFDGAKDDFMSHLRQADSMAYSANFAGGSGKPTPPAVYLQRAHDEVSAMRKEANKMNAAL